MQDGAHRGAKVGPRVAMLVSQAIVATHKALLGTKHKLAMAIFNAMSDQISEEVHRTIGPTIASMLESPKIDPAMHPLLKFMATESGQMNALAGSALAASSLFSSVAQVMNNGLAPGVRDIIALTPSQALDPVTLANIVARNIDTVGDVEHDVAGQGYNSGQFAGLVQLAQNWPGIPDLLDMLRRNVIDENTFVSWAQLNAYSSEVISKYLELATIPVSPADAALAVLRNDITQLEGEAIAAQWGIGASDFALLMNNTGEPLGLMQLLEAYRRGFIDDATLQRGILQSRVRDEWIPTATQLAYSPMSVADAVNAVVQNQLDETTAESIAQQNGLENGQFPILLNTAGEPLSRGEMFDLYNRGLATEDQVVQAERESRLKNKYNDLAFNLHIRLLEPRMLAEAVEYGATTVQAATANALAYGYSQADAAVLVGLGSARKLQTYKDKVVAAIETMYENGAVSESDASAQIQSLGHTADEANFILESVNMKRASKQLDQVVSVIRSKFMGYHIDSQEATTLMNSAGIPQSQIAYLISQWQIEIQAAVKQLTPAQIVKAAKDGLIPATPDDSAAWIANQTSTPKPISAPLDGESRLVLLGYIKDDADLLLQGA